MTTPKLGLETLAEGQASPEVPVNSDLYTVDALLQGSVLDFDVTAPPGGEDEGDAYILADNGCTGAFAGHESDVAVFQGGGYRFFQPREGWSLWVDNENLRRRYVPGSPGTWIVDSSLRVSVDGSPSMSVVDTREIVFENADVEDLGEGRVRVTPAASGSLDDLSDVVIVAPAVGEVLTWDGLKWINADPVAGSGGGGGGDGNVTPDTHPASAHALDDEFEAGSLDAKWTNLNGSTVAVSRGAVCITDASTSEDNLGGIYQATGGGNFKVRAKVFYGSDTGKILSNTAFGNRGGIFMRRSSASKVIVLGIYNDSGTGSLRFYVNKYTNDGGAGASNSNLAVSSASSGGNRDNLWQPGVYLEMEYDGTNVTFRMSSSGHDGTFVTLGTETAATFLGGAPDGVGIYNDRGTSTNLPTVCDWFRGGF